MAKRGLYANINARKRKVSQDQNLEVQSLKKAYKNMKAGFPKKKREHNKWLVSFKFVILRSIS